jgi:predicted anti-sigma-YlaC factor YlaD
MDCESYRLAISARLDGEDPELAAATLDRHLTGCPACRHWEAEATALTRAARLAAADPIPDLTPAILAAIGEERASRRVSRWDPAFLRMALGSLAFIQLFFSAPALLGFDPQGPVHALREVGSFDLALAVGFLFAAWRPERALGLLPVAAALVACLALTSVIDLAEGRAAALSESVHLLDVVGLWLVWQQSRVSGSRPVGRESLGAA